MRIVPCLLALVLVRPATAQDPPSTRELVYARITAVAPGRGNAREVLVDRGRADGLIVGWRGDAWSVHKKDDKDLGAAEVTAVAGKVARIRVTLKQPTDQVRKGDLVMVYAQVPKLQRSLLWTMARTHIGFLKNDRKTPHFTYAQLFAGETPRLVDEILQAMVEEIHYAGEQFADKQMGTKRYTKGRYKGKTPREVLVGATKPDVLRFLQFVEEYPGKYLGKSWRIDETFATWVINDAPGVWDEFREKVIAAPSREARAALILSDEAKGYRVASRLRGLAIELSKQRKFREAHAHVRAAEQAAVLLNDSSELPHILFARAYVLSDQQRYKQSLHTYQDARMLFQAAGNVASEAAVLHNIGVAQSNLGQFVRSREAYREADRLYGTIKASASSAGHTKRVYADALKRTGDFRDALKVYDEAIALLAPIDDKKNLDPAFTGKAKTLQILGRNQEAAEVYRELLAQHRKQGDKAKMAGDWENIGSQNWTLGRYRAALRAYTRSLELRKELGVPSYIATALTNMGRLQMNLGELEECGKSYREVLRIHREETKDRGDEAEALADLGRLAVALGKYRTALDRFESALAIQGELGNAEGQAYVHMQIAVLRQKRYEYELAIKAYDEAVKLRETGGAAALLGDVLRDRGAIHQVVKNYAAAEKDFRRTLAITRETNDVGAQGWSLFSLGQLAWHRQQHERARGFTRSALEIADRIENRRLKAHCRRRLGEIWSSQFDVPKARAAFDIALELFEDPQEAARTRIRIGELLRNRGDSDGALKTFRQAWREATEAQSNSVAQEALASIGGVLHNRGEIRRALRTYETALEIMPDNDWNHAWIFGLISGAHLDLGQGEAAKSWQNKAHDRYRSLRNDWGQARALNGLAEIHRRLGDAARGDELIRKALPLARQSRDRGGLAGALGTAGGIQLDLGRPDQALQYLDEALLQARAMDNAHMTAELLMLVGRARRQGGDFDGAEKALTASLAIFRERKTPYFEVEVLTEQAKLALDRKKPADALAALQVAQPVADKVDSPHMTWQVHYVRSRALEASGDLAAAATARETAIGVLDSMQSGLGSDERAQREFLKSKIEVYESMAALLGDLAGKEQPQAEQMKLLNRALQYAGRVPLEIEEDSARGGKREELRRELGRLEQRIRAARAEGNAELASTLAATRDELVDADLKLRDEDEEFANRTKFEPDTYADPTHEDNHARHLPEKARMVLYVTLKQKMHIWVYSRAGFVVWKTKDIGSAQLNGLIDEFRTLMAEVGTSKPKGRGFGPAAEENEQNPEWYRKNAKRMRKLLKELREYLLDPVAAQLTGVEKLVIVPYGRLNYLPFEALIGKDDRFLGETLQIAYCVTTKHLEKTLKRLANELEQPQHYWVAFADPVGKLHEALEEAQEIGPLFSRQQVHTQATGTATESTLASLPADCTILHFATHGYLDKTRPADHYIELASQPGGAGEDGKLMYKEIRNHLRGKMQCLRNGHLRLVVLSACSTAIGSRAATADVFAMPWAFGWAGAPAVVATLWQVNKWSTTDFMVEFYRRLVEDGETPGQAMQGARLKLLKKPEERARGRYSHPYYWSPFLLYGDWR